MRSAKITPVCHGTTRENLPAKKWKSSAVCLKKDGSSLKIPPQAVRDRMARRCCSVSTALPTSRRCIRAGMKTKCNSLYAFDIMVLNGEDLRNLPLSMRKTNLARLRARRPDGIFVAPFEQGEIGPDLFRAAAARKEADRLACEALNQRMLGYKGPAQPSPALGDALIRSRDRSLASGGCKVVVLSRIKPEYTQRQ
jgi:hypothetical protein